MVMLAWSGLSVTFAPILFVVLAKLPISRNAALAMVVTGSFAVYLWQFVFGLQDSINEVLPGILASLLCYVTFYKLEFFKAKRLALQL